MAVAQHMSLSPGSKKRKRDEAVLIDPEGKLLIEGRDGVRSKQLLGLSIAPSDAAEHDDPLVTSKSSTHTAPAPPTHLRPLTQPHRKRVRRSKPGHVVVHGGHAISNATDDANSGLASKTLAPAQSLRSCHVCYRRPATRAQLSSYADCEACGGRTCYICLRACESPSCTTHDAQGGGKKICSACCVEQGEEGLVVCMDCLEA